MNKEGVVNFHNSMVSTVHWKKKFGFQKGKLERVPYRHNMFFASKSH